MSLYASFVRESLLPTLTDIAGLSRQEEFIKRVFDTLVRDDLSKFSTRYGGYSSSLCGGLSPLEFCLKLARNDVVGLKYTFEPLAGDGERKQRLSHTVSRIHSFLDSLNWNSSSRTVEAIDRLLIQDHHNATKAIYCSTSHSLYDEMKIKIYFAGQGNLLDLELAQKVSNILATPHPEGRLEGFVNSLRVDGLSMIGVDFLQDRVESVTHYVLKPYIHLKLIHNLVLELGLSIRNYLFLILWYRRFVKNSFGRLGHFGFGLEASTSPSASELEVYLYGSGREQGEDSVSRAIENWIINSRKETAGDFLRRLTYGIKMPGYEYSPSRVILSGLGFRLPTREQCGPTAIYFYPMDPSSALEVPKTRFNTGSEPVSK